MQRRTVIGLGVVVLLGVAVAGSRVLRDEGLPVAEGRSGDACRAKGPAGLVGLDAETGAVRWTNVVGSSVEHLWVRGDQPGEVSHLSVVDGSGRIRIVLPESGAVEGCVAVSSVDPEELDSPVFLDDAGATARDRAAGAAEVVERDGSVRWRAEGRHLLAASPGGVAVVGDPPDRSGAPVLPIEVLEPATGAVRWDAELPGLSAVATEDHLVVVDQFGGSDEAASPSDARKQVARVTAYDLESGREAWHVDVPGTPQQTYADDGLILIPGFDGGPTLTAVEDGTGEVRWTAALPEPGRGGDDTEFGDLDGVVVAGDLVAVAVRSQPPYRD